LGVKTDKSSTEEVCAKYTGMLTWDVSRNKKVPLKEKQTGMPL
jgi:hypothetical protein